MSDFRRLDVWRESIAFVTQVYSESKIFPQEEKFGLTSQIRRSAVSIPSNIAEGAGRKSKTEFRQFLYIALSSSFETETQLLISNNLKYLSNEKLQELLSQLTTIQKMLQGLLKKLSND